MLLGLPYSSLSALYRAAREHSSSSSSSTKETALDGLGALPPRFRLILTARMRKKVSTPQGTFL